MAVQWSRSGRTGSGLWINVALLARLRRHQSGNRGNRRYDLETRTRDAIQSISQRCGENRREQVDVELQLAICVESVNGHRSTTAIPSGHEVQSYAPRSA